MSTRVRIALVGAGTMGRMHARVIAQSPITSLARVVDPFAEVREVAERYDAGYAAELDLSGVDAVVIAARTEAHAELTEAALNARLPVLVEKPLTDDLGETERLVRLSEKLEVPLMCGFLERFNPAVMTAASLARDVIQIHGVRHSPFVPRIGTGVATDLLIHDMDLTLRFMGSAPTTVKASFGYFHPSSRDSRAEDTADATMSFNNGSIATLTASRASHRKIRTLSLTEIDRLIEVDMLRRDVTIYQNVGDATIDEGRGYRAQTIIEIPAIPYSDEPLLAQLNRFIDLVRDKDGEEVQRERQAILPPHRAIDLALASSSQMDTVK